MLIHESAPCFLHYVQSRGLDYAAGVKQGVIC